MILVSIEINAIESRKQENPQNAGFLRSWRRRQDSNLQAREGGGFQDRCITNYATSPQ